MRPANIILIRKVRVPQPPSDPVRSFLKCIGQAKRACQHCGASENANHTIVRGVSHEVDSA